MNPDENDHGFRIDDAETLPERTKPKHEAKTYPEVEAFRALALGERLFIWNAEYTQRDIQTFWAPKFRRTCDLKVETSTSQFSYDPPGVWFWRVPTKKRKSK